MNARGQSKKWTMSCRTAGCMLALVLGFLVFPSQAKAEDYLGTNHRQDGLVDFDGDGKSDIFRSTGSSWYVSYGGTTTWTKLRDSPWEVSDGLCFGDFDGDGITDVFAAGNGEWRVSYGGTSGFFPIRTSPTTPPNIALGDFNGDGKTDIFYPDGTHWYVSYGGASNWTQVNSSSAKLNMLALGDFNGDGKTDVFKGTGPVGSGLFTQIGYWHVSYGGTSGWTEINRSDATPGTYALMPLQGDLGFADFNHDGKTDVFKAIETTFYVSDGGTGSWRVISTAGEPHQLHFGDLDGNGWDDIFKPTSLTPGGWKVWFNYGTHRTIMYLYPNTPPADTTPPVITSVTVSALTPTSATVGWMTDEPATSLVTYSVLSLTVFDPSLTTTHSLSLTGLSPNGFYNYHVSSRDAAGNEASSVGGTFVTPPLPPSSTTSTTSTTLPGSSSTTTTLPPTTTTLPSTTTTTSPPTGTTTTTTPPPRPFTDVPAGHPYADQINDMAARSVVDGYGGGLFGPEDQVKRQQFAKMIVLAMGHPVSEADVCPFSDVDVGGASTFYPDNYVAVAASRGITLGVSPGNFAPWNDITRAQLITMVARAGGAAEPPASYSPPFGNFSTTHYPWARRAAFAGLLDGLQGMGPGYDFWAPATRGEVCAILYNLVH